jgi:citrate synthase
LWYGKLPTQNELKEFRRRLAKERKLDPAIIDLVRTAPRQTQPMDVLRTAVSALSFYDAEDKKNDHDANLHKAFRLTSQIAMIVAAYDRVRKGKNVVESDPSLSHAANFLLQLNATSPRRQQNGRWIWPSSCTPTMNSTLPPSRPEWWRRPCPICIPR